eukprot:3678034-Rhodomonas_salina.1
MAAQADLCYANAASNGSSPLQSPVAKFVSNTPTLLLPMSPTHNRLPSGDEAGACFPPSHSSRSSSGLTEETVLMEDWQILDHSIKVLIYSHSALLSSNVKDQLHLHAGATVEEVCLSYIGAICKDTGRAAYDIDGHGWTSSFALTRTAMRRSTAAAVPLNRKSDMKRTLAQALGQEQGFGGKVATLHAYHVVDQDSFVNCAGNLSGTDLSGIGISWPRPQSISAPQGWVRQWSGARVKEYVM